MKITKPGNKSRIYTAKCFECDCEMEAEGSELKINYDPREHSKYANSLCMECGNSVVFYEKVSVNKG